MKEKNATIMMVTVVRVILAVIGLFVLFALLYLIYNLFVPDKELDQAKATLDLIMKAMVDAENNKENFSYVFISNPKEWYIVSFPQLGRKDFEKYKPEKCERCICICSHIKNCKKEKICREVINKKFAAISPSLSIYEKINGIIKITIKNIEKEKYFKFDFGEGINLNKVLEDGALFEDRATTDNLIRIIRILQTKDTLFKIQTINNKKKGNAVVINSISIKNGADKKDINSLLVLAILDVKYDLFRSVKKDEFNKDLKFEEKLREKVWLSFIKEKARAIEKNLDCEDNIEDSLEALSRCIATVLFEGYKKAIKDVGIDVVDNSIEAGKRRVVPENKETAALWFYAKDIDEGIKISEKFKEYKIFLEK